MKMKDLLTQRKTLLMAAGLVILSFLAGSWFQYQYRLAKQDDAAGRKILYYVDPMHPAYKSDKPGIAPDCGMKLEPVFEDGTMGGNTAEMGALAPGAVKISADRQQLIGVKVGTVEKKPVSQTIRVLGRVSVDETRVYRINATVDGWINRTSPFASGSFVKKYDVLAAFYAPDFLAAEQAYLYALSSMDRVAGGTQNNPSRGSQLEQFEINLQQYRDGLKNLGMGDPQIKKLHATRKYMENIDLISPADGIILVRNVSEGQRFEKGFELFRMADLSHIWILADIFENEAQFFAPGSSVRVSLPHLGRTLSARVSNAIPQFDAVSRTLKVRLEADNPDIALKPDMFVDVELPVHYPPTFTVPVDAVVDTGMRKIVFVEKGNGVFEPRRVDTGWRRGGLVEINRGLMNGERIVVSGTFMIDSESRMQAAALGIYDEGVMDPVCGMYSDEKKARAAGRTARWGNETYYFCSPECQHDFLKDPTKYIIRSSPKNDRAHTPADRQKHDGHDEKIEESRQLGDRMQYPGNEEALQEMRKKWNADVLQKKQKGGMPSDAPQPDSLKPKGTPQEEHSGGEDAAAGFFDTQSTPSGALHD
jgi:membrane fusion protein, copper/silver efflux system